MNKHCFRLVFSKPLGGLIPVAEITRTRRKPGQEPAASPSVFNRLALSLMLASMPAWALAEIVVDRSTSTHVISAPNGVPVIEIANPNGKGLSHNRFTEFDVQNPGVIFNNSLVNGTSQLGGALLRNPNLSRTARAILSEVTGNKPSSIAGTLEVFGDKADLLIANPNGLTINGVTTLNTSSLTISSGRVREAASGLQFEVDEHSGQVLIGADGVNTAGLSYFDIVARSVALQGAVGSQTRETDLQIAAGQGSYDSASRTFTAKPGAEGSGLAISGSAAGAMHGRFINLISSDSGAGVRHDGLIIAARDIRIDGNGDIQLTDTGAGGQVKIASAATLTNTGTLDATTGLAINAKDVVNRKGAYIGSRADLRIDASNSLSNEQDATVLSTGDMQLRADNRLNNAGTVQAGNRLAITTQELNNSGQGMLRGKTLDVSANTVSNRDGGTLYGSDTVRLDVSGNLTNQSGAGIYAQNALTLNVLGTLLNEAATVAANTLYLNVGSLTNRSAAKVLADADLSINATGAILNDAATLAGNTVSLKAGSLRNQAGGQVLADTDLTIHANTTLSNAGGTLAAGDKLTLKAGSDFTNQAGGQVLGTDIDLLANHVTSTTGSSIQAARNLSIDSGSFSVSNSELLAGNNLSLTLGSYQNSGTISSQNTASLTLKNNANLLIDSAFNAPQAANLLTLSANNVTVTGELNAPGSVQINAAGSVRNQGAIIIGKTLGITALGLIDNHPGKLIWAGEHLILQAGTELLNGFNSQLLAMGDMSLNAGKKLQNDAGRIEAQGNLWIDTPMLENLSRSTGGIGQDGTLGEDTWYGEEYRLLEVGYHHLRFDMPKYQSTIAVTQQGVIKAGESLLLNQDTAKGTQASVRNVGGLMAAGDNMVVDGNLANVGISASHSLMDVLKTATLWGKWSNSGPWPDDDPFGGSAYDILDQVILPANADSRWLSSLKKAKSTELNQLLSAVLGADWKALKLNDLSARWTAFKATNKTQAFYADTQAEISAGKTFVHEGGSFENGDGANWGAQRPITVKVGSQTVQSLDGELNAEFNLGRDKAQQILKEQLENPLFRVRQPGVEDGAFARIKPLYETRTQFLDQNQFFGSEYFLEKIGYDPSKSVTVLGDAYFDHQLIVQSIEQQMGNFFAKTQRLSGTALVSHLLDNGASLTSQSGFVLGQPLTAEQIASLKTDVVWYENQLIDGQVVLAPRLYLSEKTLAARAQDANSSALVSADTVLIDALAVNNVNGTIRGNTDTFIYSKTDINNVSVGGTQAGIFAGQGGEGKTAGQLVIAAEGKVVNQGGIMSGYQQTVVGGDGVSSSATTGYDKNGYLVVRDNGVMGVALSETDPEPQPEATTASAEPPAEKKTYEVARPDVRAIFEERLASGPVDTSQGSSLSVISAGDIDLTGAITQSDNVLLQTSGDVTMDDLHEARSAFDSRHARGFFSSKTVTEMAASANSVGNTLNAKNLTVHAQGDWTITGGEINTDTSNVRVGGDMTVAAGQDLAFHEKTVKSTQLVIGGGAGVGGYEANASWSSALTFDTQLASPFDGLGEDTESLRGHATAGRSAASQALASEGTGSRTGANKGRGGTSGANVKVGLEMVTTVDTSESSTYRNAQLNLGSGSVDVAGTFDFGGADINAGYQLSPQERATLTPEQRIAATNAMPTLDISAGDIKTTKYESTEKTSHSREELFFGMTAEVHSSLADVATQVAQTAHKALGTDAVNDPNTPAGSSKTQAMAEGAMEIDPALTAIAAVGMATQVAFGEVLGASRTFGMQHTEETRDSESRSENINQVGGNISLTSTQGDIALNGVNLQGGKVAIKSAGNLTQQAAKSSTTSSESVTTHRVGLTESIGVAPTGVGMGVSVGADGSYDETTTRATSYTNGLISGTEVSIETAGDHNLIGSNIKGNQVTANIGGNQTITSVQDTSEMTHDRSNWSASVGVAITTNGIIQGTASASASGGRDFDNSKLTAEQAGISADSLDLNVAGNLNLTGAHITSNPGQGSVDVGGKITAQNLHDSREKDGGYAGGGGGISKNGLPSVTLEFGRVDQVNYQADNLATIDVGDTSKVTAAQGISGQLNTDADKQLNVTQNKRVAGTDVRIEISIEDAEEIKSGVKNGVKNLFSGRSSSSKYVADAPTARARSNETSKPKTSAGETPKAGYGDMPAAKPKPKFEQRVIVNTDTSDPTVNRAVQNLANKHPDNSVVIAPTAEGKHNVLQGTLASGASTKVEVVGHSDGASLGNLNSQQITDVLQNLKAETNAQIDKVALVGCGTSCAKDGSSLVNDVGNLLLDGASTTQVKGYPERVDVNDQGRKYQPDEGGLLFGGARKKYKVSEPAAKANWTGFRLLADQEGSIPRTEAAIKNDENTLYRLDFRPPEVIAKEGFAGSNATSSDWFNLMHGNETVYAAQSLKGLHHFAVESLLGKPASGLPGNDPFPQSRAKFFTGDAYVYKIQADGLPALHVGESLGFGKNPTDSDMRLKNLKVDSPIIQKIYESTPLPSNAELLAELGELPADPQELERVREETRKNTAELDAFNYFNRTARYTDEVILKGPIPPSRIELYQRLPVNTKTGNDVTLQVSKPLSDGGKNNVPQGALPNNGVSPENVVLADASALPEDKHQVVVQVGGDQTVRDAAKNLADKHPLNTTQYLREADGSLSLIAGAPITGSEQKLKVQVVGHGDASGATIGGADAAAVVDIVKQIQDEFHKPVDKLTLAGCNTAACLVGKVQEQLNSTTVSGFNGPRAIDGQGRKFDVKADDPQALIGRKRDRAKRIPTDADGYLRARDVGAQRAPSPAPDYPGAIATGEDGYLRAQDLGAALARDGSGDYAEIDELAVGIDTGPAGHLREQDIYVDTGAGRGPSPAPDYADAIATGDDGYLRTQDLGAALATDGNDIYAEIDELAVGIDTGPDGQLRAQDIYVDTGASRGPSPAPDYFDATSSRPVAIEGDGSGHAQDIYVDIGASRSSSPAPDYADGTSTRPVPGVEDGSLRAQAMGEALASDGNDVYAEIDERVAGIDTGADGYLRAHDLGVVSTESGNDVYAEIDELAAGIDTDADGYLRAQDIYVDIGANTSRSPAPDYADATSTTPVAVAEGGSLHAQDLGAGSTENGNGVYAEIDELAAGIDTDADGYLRAQDIYVDTGASSSANPTVGSAKADNHQVIVQAGTDRATGESARNLASKHPTTTTRYLWNPDGTLKLVSGKPQASVDRGLKVQVVGHGEEAGNRIGGADAKAVVDIVKQVEGQFGKEVNRLTLAGCNTSGCLAQQVEAGLPNTDVRGFNTTRAIGGDGRKLDVPVNDPRALINVHAVDQQGSNDAAISAPADGTDEPVIKVYTEREEKLLQWAQKNLTIDNERGEFLAQVKNKVAEQLLDGPVLLGEDHNYADAGMVIQHLIAEGKVKNLLYEGGALSDDLAADSAGRALAELIQARGYASIEHYLDTSFVSPGVRNDPDVLQGIIEFYNEGNAMPWDKRVLADAFRTGVNVHPIDARDELGDAAGNDDFRNRYMAWAIDKTAGLNGPGTIGSFGSHHLKLTQSKGELVPSLQDLAHIDNSRVYDLTPVFQDYQTGKFYPRWSELSRDNAIGLPSPILSMEPFHARQSKAPWSRLKAGQDGGVTYAPDKYEHRIVVDSVNNPLSTRAADKLLKKHAANTLVLKDYGQGRLEYAAGEFATDDVTLIRTAKLSLLRSSRGLLGGTDLDGVVEALNEKLSNSLQIKKVEKVKVGDYSGTPHLPKP